MMDSRLILLEGMPSTGKTTNSRFLQIQLDRSNIDAQWIHEVAMPHPVLFFDEAVLTHDEYAAFSATYPEAAAILSKIAVFRKSTVGLALPEIDWHYREQIGDAAYQALLKFDAWNFPLAAYKKCALEKWAHFVERALENPNTVYIMDSAVFQYQIFCFLFQNRPYEELQRFVGQIAEILRPLNPCLIFLYRENTETTIDYLENDRGTAYLDYIWDRDKDQPYYADKPPGAESFKQFLRDYAGMAGSLFAAFPASKLSLEISDGNWTCREEEMLSFLGIDRMPGPDALPQDGVYTEEALGYVISVDGLSITDPTGKTRTLYPKTHDEFYVDWLPTVLRFEDDKLILAGSQVGDRWTTTGMVYTKVIRPCP